MKQKRINLVIFFFKEKSQNVGVKNNFNFDKLCDFFSLQSTYMTRLKGTVRYSYETYGD